MAQRHNRFTDTRYGKMLYNQNDYILGKSLEQYGEWSQSEMDFLSAYIPYGGVCIDVGANVGTHTLFFANAVGPQGSVIAFEPQPIIFYLLCANIALNEHFHVSASNVAISSSSGLIHFPYVDYQNPYNFGLVGMSAEGGYPVQSRALDDYGFASIDLIKIDVEGSEPEVIMGAVRCIEKFQPLIYSEYHPTVHSQNLAKLIQELGYDVYLHHAVSFNPENFKGDRTNFHGDYQETNVFCVPKSKNLAVDLPKMEEWKFL
ncbi:MAG: methyltransferase, FkbM family [Parachlamydiales bacterium]|nr:methyltransferase, FkbM family [Parachlamydiales bacterium]